MLHFRTFVIATMAAVAAYAQNPITADSPYQVKYASNLTIGDSVINITNTGARGAGLGFGTSASVTGAICVNVYVYDPSEEVVSCCSCPVTPNGLVSLSAKNDLINNPLTRGNPTSIVIKLLATVPVGGTCNNSALLAGSPTLAPGMAAWGTTLHANPTSAAAGTYARDRDCFHALEPKRGRVRPSGIRLRSRCQRGQRFRHLQFLPPGRSRCREELTKPEYLFVVAGNRGTVPGYLFLAVPVREGSRAGYFRENYFERRDRT